MSEDTAPRREPETRPSLHDVVVQGIQDMLVSGEVGPGDRLPVEPVLAERFGVSRSSLREGVRALVAMGVLVTRQGSGTQVTSLDPHLLLRPLVFWSGLQGEESSHDVHQVRKALEVEAAGEAALRRTEEDVARLGAILDAAEPAIGALDHTAAMDQDLLFHRGLADAARNPVLGALIDALARPTLRIRMWQAMHRTGRLTAAHQEHRAIHAAVAAGDPVAARAAMYTHMAQVAAHLDG
ncbi:FadR/GntR family transcriptional regulator [Nocardiopsis sp. MG754419]|uniref:FadR/GntR family transcriptional regulator n=1 Tax=Nocardiopsis sp. MG754419 TaxID=2259865 RepID=UPI001BA7FD98|nr:FadR/GntR family transcriptional regulator [Nocardiopsis sp. MG754419]MBR8742974.1 FadR family transcriptional regulator [Nocardiopsis sp. MG754419]